MNEGIIVLEIILFGLCIVGGIAIFIFALRVNWNDEIDYNRIIKELDEQKKEFTAFFIMLILMGITNPIHTALPLMYVLWFLVPMSIKLYNECKENKKYEAMET